MIAGRDEWVRRVKERAVAELNADPEGRGPANACASVMSDLRKHPDTAGHLGIEVTMILLVNGELRTAAQVREHIEGLR